MKVIVDTSVWSLVLRRSSPSDSETVQELRDLAEYVPILLHQAKTDQ